MAEPIVRSFVIDTTESEQNLKELNTQINATSAAINQGAQSFENVAAAEESVVASSKSLKAQLRELQAQLAATDPQSKKYVELSQRAGELKDAIGDAAEAVGTQAGSAFERLGNSAGLLTGRLANLDFAGAAEGAKLFAQNITSIKFSDITNGIKSLGSTLASVGKALLTNPIFLIGAALAVAISYTSQFIKGLDGVSEVDRKNLEIQKEKAALAKQQLDAIGQQEETLKRQGLTEKQISDLKLKALDTAILEQQVVIETSKTQAAAQIAAAERNFKYLKGFLDFVTLPQKKLTEFFFNFYNGAVDLLNKLGLGIEKVDVGKIVAGFDDVTTFLTKKIFDPEETRKEGEKVIQESEATLRQLTNQRDGILNAQEAKEKAAAQKAADDRLKAEQDLANQIIAIRKKTAEESLKLSEQIRKDAAKPIDSAKSDVKDFDAELKAQQDAEDLRISLMAEGQDKEIALVDAKYAKLRAQAGDNAELQKQITQKNIDEVNAIIENGQQKEVAIRQEGFKKGLELAQNAIAIIQAFSDASTKNSERDAKKKFKTDKALAIGAATVQTASAVTGALTAGGNPIKLATGQQFVEASIAAALGLAQIIKIKNSQFGSTGGGDSSTNTNVPSTGGGGAETQPAQFNPLAAQFIQNQPEQITPRAFVLAGDVASQQEVREKVEDLARLG